VRHRVHQTATELLERGVAAEGEPPKSRTLVRKKSAEQRAK
jgi:hypothetical protein